MGERPHLTLWSYSFILFSLSLSQDILSFEGRCLTEPSQSSLTCCQWFPFGLRHTSGDLSRHCRSLQFTAQSFGFHFWCLSCCSASWSFTSLFFIVALLATLHRVQLMIVLTSEVSSSRTSFSRIPHCRALSVHFSTQFGDAIELW